MPGRQVTHIHPHTQHTDRAGERRDGFRAQSVLRGCVEIVTIESVYTGVVIIALKLSKFAADLKGAREE